MRDYGKIYTSLWRSRKFTSLESDDAKLLYLYLHTCAHANMVGCFILPDGYATADLEWDTTRYRHALDTLSTACLVGVDRGEKLVRIVDFLRHDPFTNASHATGAIKITLALPDCDERSFLFQDLSKSKWVAAGAIPTPCRHSLVRSRSLSLSLIKRSLLVLVRAREKRICRNRKPTGNRSSMRSGWTGFQV